MSRGDPDDSPEYFRAKAEWVAYWKRIREGLENGIGDDVAVAVARLAEKFGMHQIQNAISEYIENLGSNFERRWCEHREARVREQDEINQRLRNPKGAGRKSKRSDQVLMAAWLLVQKSMRLKGLSGVRDACKLLVKPPTRREASRWPGLLLYRDYAANDRAAGSYYIKTPENLRDVYNDAVELYEAGPESLRQRWQAYLDVLAPARVGKLPPQ